MTASSSLRQLARDIEALCHASECIGIASPIVENAASHLCAIARIHELNEEQNGKRAE